MITYFLHVGTLVRTCAAAGCESLITSQGCVDVWDPKVLRCAAGGHFYLPIHYNLSWDKIGKLLPQNKKIFLADSSKPGEILQIVSCFYIRFGKHLAISSPSTL